MYGTKLVSDSSGRMFLGALAANRWGLAALGITLAGGGIVWRLRRHRPSDYSMPSLGLCLVAQACIMIYGGFLVWFYRGVIPPDSRYQFPSVFISLAGLLTVSWWLMRLEGPRTFRLLAVILATTLVVGYGVTEIRIRSLAADRAMAIAYTKATDHFHQRLELLFQRARQNPRRPVLFRSFGLNDTEPLSSVDLFMRANGLRNPVYLQIVGYSAETTRNAAEMNLFLITTNFITSGRFHAAAELPPGADPIIANFSNPVLADGAVANYWPVW